MKKRYGSMIVITILVISGIITGCRKDNSNSTEIVPSANGAKEEIEQTWTEDMEMTEETTVIEEPETQEKTVEETEPEETATTEMTLPETTQPESTQSETTVPETTMPETTTAQLQAPTEPETIVTPGIQAKLLREHYAGDVLVAGNFRVEVTRENGEVLVNPAGWTATPLQLVEGENRITVCYENYSTVLTVNAGIRPENDAGTTSGVKQEWFQLAGVPVLTQTPDMGQEYLDKIIFLGDSRTYGYKAYGVLSGGQNTMQVWTPRSGTMTLSAQAYALIYYPDTGTDISIRDAVAMKKPEYMVIGLGTNGISYMSEEAFKGEFRSLINDIKAISPNTKIMLNSIYPVACYYARLDLINNQKVIAANKWLVEIAEETGVKYLNTAEVLVDEQGWLDMRYDNNGGATHLNRQGNQLVMQYIRTHGYQ